MLNRNLAGRGQRGGMGFGFRGSSPPWPYAGRGRGGLPRCSYYLGGRTNFPTAASVNTPEQEINFLKSQAEALKAELTGIESRISNLKTSQ